MQPDLFACLKEERSIFRIFDSTATIGDFEAFHSPHGEAIAHWNLAYPLKPGKDLPSPAELSALLDHYASNSLQGHLATTDKKLRDKAVEECEYFLLEQAPSAEAGWPVSGLRHRPEDMKLFASVIQTCFILSDTSKEAFLEKMAKLHSHEGSQFYVIENSDGRILGCANTIRTASGADFLFNVGAIPDFADAKHMGAIVSYVAMRSKLPLFTYHRHPLMRDKILRKAGFSPLGIVFCVPLADLFQS